MSMRQLAHLLRRAPWIVSIGRWLWRLKQPRFSAGVVGVVFDDEGRLLLVEHVFHPHKPWGLPGGWIDRHEHPHETIRREFLEELSMKIEVGPLLLAEANEVFGGHLDLAYLCSTRDSVGQISSELLTFDWYSVDQLPTMHGFHTRALQAALRFRKQYSQSLV